MFLNLVKKIISNFTLLWYRTYSDKWIEQHALLVNFVQNANTGANQTWTFIKPFTNTDYTIISGNRNLYEDWCDFQYGAGSKYTTSIQIYTWNRKRGWIDISMVVQGY